MCEENVLRQTGLDVAEHQRRSVASLIELQNLAPLVPWMPVLQGFEPDDYLRCADLYAAAGVDLEAESLVGVGTVCRRQATREVCRLISRLSELGLALHGFGVKLDGLAAYGWALKSADSMAWSLRGRYGGNLCGRPGHKRCNHCVYWALEWREGKVLPKLVNQQPTLWAP